MLRFLLWLIVSLTCVVPVAGQFAEHTWSIGGGDGRTRTGIRFDFNTSQPPDYSGIRSPLDLQENNTIISDGATGEVIIYSDGQQVVDAAHQPMPDGIGLRGTPSNMYGTSVVLDPAGCRTYYLFYGEDETATPPRSLYFARIDLDLPGNGRRRM